MFGVGNNFGFCSQSIICFILHRVNMLKTYLKTAWRNLWKHKLFTVINLSGLTIGLTSFILIALYIYAEYAFDRFHRQADNIYRMVEKKTSADGTIIKRAATGFQVSFRAREGFPEIQDVARISVYWRAEVAPGDQRTKVSHEVFTAANPGFLNVFSFPLLHGDRSSALTEPRSVLLTESSAQKFFGESDVVGKLLYFDDDPDPYRVTGVLENFPVNSSISFNLLVSEASILTNDAAKEFMANDWSSGAFATYYLLKSNTDISALNTKLDQLIASNYQGDPGVKSQVQLQALKDIHFYSNDIEGDSGQKGQISYIYAFLTVAFFILIIACINYMNLSTARSANKGKEIAVLKVAGATRTSLIQQILTEVLLLTLCAVIFSLGLVNLFLPALNSFAEKNLTLNLHTEGRIWLGVLLITLIVTIMAGVYPAVFQSGLHPISLLKNKVSLGRGNISLRRFLVVFQFVISIVLITATLVIYEQMQYVDKKDMGFEKEKLVVIDINSGVIRRNSATIKEEFLKLAPVSSVSVSSRVPGEWKTIPVVKVTADGAQFTDAKDMYFLGADEQFLATYGIKLLTGRNFLPSGKGDSSAVLLNETAAKMLGIGYDLGQTLALSSVNFGGDTRSDVEKPFTVNVVGVVKDFNFQSLYQPLASMVIGFEKTLGMSSFGYLTVKLTGNNYESTINKLNDILRRVDQTHLFEYHFLDKQWDLLYRQDKISQILIFLMALLTIFIAALGLLGLTIYTAEQKVKEIGIRKVMGANISGIMFLLSREFIKLVLIASIVAIPLAWFFMHKWLENFSYRISIHWSVFILATLLALFIALITISVQVIKAAIVNPVEVLRVD